MDFASHERETAGAHQLRCSRPVTMLGIGEVVSRRGDAQGIFGELEAWTDEQRITAEADGQVTGQVKHFQRARAK